MSQTPPLSVRETSLPLAVSHVIAGATRRGQLRADASALYWLEQRPEANGRGEIRRWSASGGVETLTPESLSVRSRVHEYGGGEFAVHSGRLIFTADPGQRLWLRDIDGSVREMLPASTAGNDRYADFVWHPNGRSVFAVRERHDGAVAGNEQVSNALVRINLDGGCVTIAQGADFCAAPAISPDGRQLAWLQWNHPQMPWDGTELWLASLAANGELTGGHRLAGGPDESILQPGFSAAGELLAMSDRGGFWQLSRFQHGSAQPVALLPGECAVAPWSLGTRTWAETADGERIVIASIDGRQQLWRLPSGSAPTQLPLEFDSLAAQLAVAADRIFVLGASAREGECVIAIDRQGGAVTRLTQPPKWPAGVAITPAKSGRLPTATGELPFLLYQPAQSQSQSPPPLLVLCHSGPTGQALPSLQAAIQFWTSRGFAVADVNYRGSDGYGRRWRQSLRGQWGRADVDDCLAVTEHLLASGQFDRQRVYVRGNSAGALTVLQLLTRTAIIRAAAVRYPVVDLPSLAAASHKFEALYLEQLVGGKAALATASPSQRFGQIRTPLLIQHGDSDPVVPLDQAERPAAALERNGIAHQLKVYAGEGHGFRRADTLASALEAEWAFFNRTG